MLNPEPRFASTRVVRLTIGYREILLPYSTANIETLALISAAIYDTDYTDDGVQFVPTPDHSITVETVRVWTGNDEQYKAFCADGPAQSEAA